MSESIPFKSQEFADSVVILPARLEWAESFRLCVDQVAREKRYFLLEKAPALDKIRDFLTKLATLGHPHYFALRGSRVVGWCNVKRLEQWGRTHVGELSMGLHPEFRGRGLGRKLIEACLREARLLNYHKVELTVFADNERALRLYRSTGFVEEGRISDFAKIGEEYRDAVLMGLLL